jgi:hypothetical protein
MTSSLLCELCALRVLCVNLILEVLTCDAA